MVKNIALLRGDGIGPEIVDSAVAVLKVVAEKFGHTFNFTPYLIGGGQEQGLRSGTEATPAIIGFGAASYILAMEALVEIND